MTPTLGRDGPRVEVDGWDEQDDVAVDVARWVTLAEHTLESEGIRDEAGMSLLFVDEAAIADLNRRYLGEDRPTDVLAFPIDDDPALRDTVLEDTVPRLLGDVVVCPAVAARQAPDHDSSLEDELALLVVHGVLHVLGHDHADATETAAMQARQRQILDSFRP